MSEDIWHIHKKNVQWALCF